MSDRDGTADWLLSVQGRIARIVAGSLLIIIGLGLIGGFLGVLLMIIGAIPIASAAYGTLLIGPLFGRDIRGRRPEDQPAEEQEDEADDDERATRTSRTRTTPRSPGRSPTRSGARPRSPAPSAPRARARARRTCARTSRRRGRLAAIAGDRSAASGVRDFLPRPTQEAPSAQHQALPPRSCSSRPCSRSRQSRPSRPGSAARYKVNVHIQMSGGHRRARIHATTRSMISVRRPRPLTASATTSCMTARAARATPGPLHEPPRERAPASARSRRRPASSGCASSSARARSSCAPEHQEVGERGRRR